MVSITWLTQNLASVVGTIVSALITEKFHPRYGFLLYSLYGFFLGVACFWLSSACERQHAAGEIPVQSDFSSELKKDQTPSEALIDRKRIQEEIGVPGEESTTYIIKKNL